MWRSVIYKEWLKVRWFQLGLVLIGLLVTGNVFLKVQHDITFREAHNLWYFILFQGYSYFGGLLKYLPLVIGAALSIAQYVPEITSKRIKLTFHLPINENKVLIMMLGFGLLCLLATFGLIYILFLVLSHHFFGPEIVHAANISVIPWFLSGFVAYFMVAMIVLEPVWKYRVFYIVVVYFCIMLFLEPGLPGSYQPLNWKLAIVTVLSSISLLFSAYRFRKGEM